MKTSGRLKAYRKAPFFSLALGLLLSACGKDPPHPTATPSPPILSPAPMASLLQQAQQQRRLGDHTQAAQLFRRVLAHDSTDQAAHAGLAGALLKLGQPLAAIQACSTGLALDGQAWPLYHTLAAAYASQGHYAQAIQSLEAITQGQPDDVLAQVNLGGIYTQLGRYDQAEDFLKAARRLAPHQVAVRRRLGELFLHTGRPDSALGEFKTALRGDPDGAVLHFLSGKAHETARPEQALEAYRQARRRDPGFADAHYRTAVLARRLGRATLADSALQAFQNLRAIGADHPERLTQLKELRAAVLDAPEEPLHHFQLALFFARHGYTSQALNRFARVLHLAPDDFRAMNHMGSILLRGKQAAQALEFFTSALIRNARFTPAHLNAGNAYMVLEKPSEAARHYAQAAQLAPKMPVIWHQLAQARLALGDRAQALQAVEKGLAVSGTDGTMRRVLEALAQDLGSLILQHSRVREVES